MAASSMIKDDLAEQSRTLVYRELTRTLDAARQELEGFADGQSDASALRPVAEQLHLVRGALKIVEQHGPGMLAEEMEAACRHLDQQEEPREAEAELEALTAAMVQFPAYLDRVVREEHDLPLVLLPLVNDLREARGATLLSGAALFLLGGPSPAVTLSGGRETHAQDEDKNRRFRATVRKLRPTLQRALLGWIRGSDEHANVARLVRVCEAVAQTAVTEPVQQLWLVLGAVLNAVVQGNLEASVTLKRLVGQADRHLRQLVDSGEAAFVHAPPVELLSSLLGHVARVDGEDTRIRAIRERYRLNGSPDRAGASSVELLGPSERLLRTVAEAIKEDLEGVKDALDLFARSDLTDVGQLEVQLDMLKKIGDTLGVLGLEEACERIQSEADALARIVAQQELASAAALEAIARVVLDVEDALARELLRTVGAEGAGAEAGAPVDRDSEFHQVTSAVIRECVVNLAKVKESVTELVGTGFDGSALDRVRPQLRGITAGLLMLDKSAAVKVVERIGEVIATRLGPSREPMKPEYLERLADAIVSVEYYMETVSLGRTDPDYMLENASRCLAVLEMVPRSAAGSPQTEAESEPASERERAAAPRPELELGPEPGAAPAPAPELAVAPQSASVAQKVMPADAVSAMAQVGASGVDVVPGNEPDPELLAIFIEEAREEIASIERFLPAWVAHRADADALISVRRSFHTLKGSGRMVGATVVGEFAWAMENLLNRVINQTLVPSERVASLLQRAAAALPSLVGELENGTTAASDTSDLVREARALAEGRDSDRSNSDAAEANETADVDAGTAATVGANGMDPALADIFVDEVQGHAAVLREYLDAPGHTELPRTVSEPVFRAGHTFLGSARAAGLEPAVRLAAALNALLVRGYEDELPLAEDALAAVRAAADEMDRMVRAIRQGEPCAVPDELVARLDQLARDRVPDSATSEAKLRASANELPRPSELDDTVDSDVKSIFAEEAAELLETADDAMQRLHQDSTAPEAGIDALQRVLHTLKGGARVAGVVAVGDLSHALETLLAATANGHVALSTQILDVVQRTIDRLQQMRDQLERGTQIADGTALIGELEALAEGREAPEVPRAEAEDFVAQAASGEASDTDEAGVAEAFRPTLMEPPSEPHQEHAQDVGVPMVPGASGEGLSVEAPITADDAADGAHSSFGGRSRGRAELARVDTALLDELLNGAGEVSIFQSRLQQQVRSFDFHLGELGETVTRLREQLRKLEAETEAQILHGHHDAASSDDGFDPLELDRYSTIQQLSRALAETANDVASIDELLHGLATDADTLLTQQARVTSDLQDGLMKTRMVPFQRHVSRLSRIVRQAASELGRQAELVVAGAANEVDRHVLDSMLAPLEHLLRNAVVHGIESPADRQACGKPELGRIDLKLRREGSEVIIEVVDDGAGLDLDAIRRKAFEQGVIAAPDQVSDAEAADLILRPGFSTAGTLTQAAGRGVGMDVVDNEVKKLGGSMRIESEPGRGTHFVIRLPFTLAITHALIVDVGGETFALPLPTVEGVTRIPRDELLALLSQDAPVIEYGGIAYRLQHLGSLIDSAPSALPDEDSAVSLVLVRAGDNSAALLTDALEGSKEIVVKGLGPHLATVTGVSGATILGDGRVVMILDATTLLRAQRGPVLPAQQVAVPQERPLTALVVDDSITMRRVTQRMLERRGIKVLTARDGLDAIDVLQDAEVDIILLDIEMPRMDGYQFATHVRNDTKLSEMPIIMITSRSGEKHRAKAIEIGVNDYLVKPYQDDQLLAAVDALTGGRTS